MFDNGLDIECLLKNTGNGIMAEIVIKSSGIKLDNVNEGLQKISNVKLSDYLSRKSGFW